jgi:uncharacterized membrane protein YuzA (DUF378 family)
MSRNKTLLATFAFLAMNSWVDAARAEILHAYILVESQNLDQDAVVQGLGGNLGMCKYVVVGSINTETIGVTHTIIRLDCEGQDSLNALIAHAGTGIAGVTRASVLEAFRQK